MWKRFHTLPLDQESFNFWFTVTSFYLRNINKTTTSRQFFRNTFMKTPQSKGPWKISLVNNSLSQQFKSVWRCVTSATLVPSHVQNSLAIALAINSYEPLQNATWKPVPRKFLNANLVRRLISFIFALHVSTCGHNARLAPRNPGQNKKMILMSTCF